MTGSAGLMKFLHSSKNLHLRGRARTFFFHVKHACSTYVCIPWQRADKCVESRKTASTTEENVRLLQWCNSCFAAHCRVSCLHHALFWHALAGSYSAKRLQCNRKNERRVCDTQLKTVKTKRLTQCSDTLQCKICLCSGCE